MTSQPVTRRYRFVLDPDDEARRIADAALRGVPVDVVIVEELHSLSRDLGLAEHDRVRVAIRGSAIEVAITIDENTDAEGGAP